MTDPAPSPPAIQLTGINKSFGAVHANKNIDLTVEKGTIHGIVGENGAGKSTLMSILYGFYHADSGEIRIDGKARKIADSRQAIGLGIGMVHQHFMLVEPFTVLENIMLGVEGGMLLARGRAKVRAALKQLADDYGLEVDPDTRIANLPVGLQQRVEILKALYRGAETLILDEPTGVLTPSEADHLFRILKVLKSQGKTIILITHKLREIMAVTDSVSVMRRGEMVATFKTAETTPEDLAETMVGRRVLMRIDKHPASPGDVLLAVDNVSLTDERGVKLLHDISLEVREGEIVGIAGVAGNGQSELLEVLSGIRRPQTGTITINGEQVTSSWRFDAAMTRHNGLAHVPEDRHRMGLIMPFEQWENAHLGYHREETAGEGAYLDIFHMRELANHGIKDFDIRPPDCRLKTANFSGGNQQKIVLAREIERDPKVLIVGQPTRGVDIGAIEAIHRRLLALRDCGKAILLVSVELDEIRSLSDRVLVMCGGRIVGEQSPETSEGEIGLLMAGVTEAAA